MDPVSNRNVEGDSMNTGMANLSLNNPQPQIPTHLSPHTSFSSTKSDRLKLIDQMGSSNPSTSNLNLSPYNNAAQAAQHAEVLEASSGSTHAIPYTDAALGHTGSHSNPSLPVTPHANEPDTVNFVSINRKPEQQLERHLSHNVVAQLFGRNSSMMPRYQYELRGPQHDPIWTAIIYS
jgi:hypothetical protein